MQAIFSALAEREPDNPAHLYALATSHQQLAINLHRSNEIAAARLELDNADRAITRLDREHPEAPDQLSLRSSLRSDRAQLFHALQGQTRETLTLTDEALELLEKSPAEYRTSLTGSLHRARLLRNRAQSLEALGEKSKAEAGYREALGVMQAVEGKDRLRPEAREGLADCWQALGGYSPGSRSSRTGKKLSLRECPGTRRWSRNFRASSLPRRSCTHPVRDRQRCADLPGQGR